MSSDNNHAPRNALSKLRHEPEPNYVTRPLETPRSVIPVKQRTLSLAISLDSSVTGHSYCLMSLPRSGEKPLRLVIKTVDHFSSDFNVESTHNCTVGELKKQLATIHPIKPVKRSLSLQWSRD